MSTIITRLGGFVRRVALVTAVAGALTVMAAVEPAAASPSGCGSVAEGANGAKGICTGGTGQYRVFVRCDGFLWADYRVNGPWLTVGSGLESSADCGDFDARLGYGMQTLGPIS
jgi:hypothetical protein